MIKISPLNTDNTPKSPGEYIRVSRGIAAKPMTRARPAPAANVAMPLKTLPASPLKYFLRREASFMLIFRVLVTYVPVYKLFYAVLDRVTGSILYSLF